ncbi:unnamed protein product [Absidia cylindrospora]
MIQRVPKPLYQLVYLAIICIHHVIISHLCHYTKALAPDYQQETVELSFNSDDDYKDWISQTLTKHTDYVYHGKHIRTSTFSATVHCKRHINQIAPSSSSRPPSLIKTFWQAKRQKINDDSMKIGSRSRYSEHFYSDKTMSVEYKRIPMILKESSRPDCVLNYGNGYMAAKSIVPLLRLNNGQLDDIDMNIQNGCFHLSSI